MKTREIALAALFVLAAGTACGERSEPTGPSVSIYPVTVADSEDRAITLAREPRRIVALTDATADIVRALGDGRRLVAAPGRFFGPTGALLASRLRAAKPDLVVAESDTDGIGTRATTLEAPVYFAPNGSVEEVERGITRLGLLLDHAVEARRVVHGTEEQRARIARELAGTSAVSVFVDTGFFTTVPDRSLIGDLVRQAHGRNVAGASPEPGPIDLGDLLRLDPAVYLATSDSETTLRDLRKDPRTRKLRAIRNGRFAIVDAQLLEPGPHVGEGLREIARALHPNAVR